MRFRANLALRSSMSATELSTKVKSDWGGGQLGKSRENTPSPQFQFLSAKWNTSRRASRIQDTIYVGK